MKDSEFDDIIKGTLDDHASATPGDWSAMADHIERSEQQEDALDTKIQEELRGLEDHQGSSDQWTLLQRRLDYTDQQHRSILLAKAVELSVLLLAFLVYHHMYEPIALLQNRLQAPVLMADKIKHHTRTLETSTALLEHTSVYDQVISGDRSLRRQAPNLHYPTYTALLPEMALVSSMDRSLPAGSTDYLPLVDPEPLPIMLRDLVIHQLIYPVLLDPQANRADLLVSAYASVNTDIISTPDDGIYEGVNGYLHYAEGLSIGSDIILRYPRWDFKTGLRFTRQDYDPRHLSETNVTGKGTTTTKRLDDISYDIISIPLAADYRVIHRPRFSAFVGGGLSNNFVASARYEIKEQEQTSEARVTRSVQVNSKNDIDQNFQLSQKPFNEGLFRSGNLQDNFFLTCMLGAGIELRPDAATALQLGIHYHHNISNQIGPNEDRVNTVGIQLAVLRSI